MVKFCKIFTCTPKSLRKRKSVLLTGTCKKKARRIYYFTCLANKSFAPLWQVSCSVLSNTKKKLEKITPDSTYIWAEQKTTTTHLKIVIRVRMKAPLILHQSMPKSKMKQFLHVLKKREWQENEKISLTRKFCKTNKSVKMWQCRKGVTAWCDKRQGQSYMYMYKHVENQQLKKILVRYNRLIRQANLWREPRTLPHFVIGRKTQVAAGHVPTQNLVVKKNVLGERGGISI